MSSEKPSGHIDISSPEIHGKCVQMLRFLANIQDSEIRSLLESPIIEINRALIALEQNPGAAREEVQGQMKNLTKIIIENRGKNENDDEWLGHLDAYVTGVIGGYISRLPVRI